MDAKINEREISMQGSAAEIAYLLQMTGARCADLRGELAVANARVKRLTEENAALTARLAKLAPAPVAVPTEKES